MASPDGSGILLPHRYMSISFHSPLLRPGSLGDFDGRMKCLKHGGSARAHDVERTLVRTDTIPKADKPELWTSENHPVRPERRFTLHHRLSERLFPEITVNYVCVRIVASADTEIDIGYLDLTLKLVD